jgi:hypothetical protein
MCSIPDIWLQKSQNSGVGLKGMWDSDLTFSRLYMDHPLSEYKS